MDPKKNHISAATGHSESKTGPSLKEVFQNTSADVSTPSVAEQISEVVGEMPQEFLPTQQTQKGSSPRPVSPEERKAQLLGLLPKDEKLACRKMRGEIKIVVEKKLNKLESEARFARRMAPYHLSNLLRAIRYLRDILAQLATAAYEYLKTLWLKIVYNLSV